MTWTIDQARTLYGIERWSEGFFDIDEQGRLLARPQGTDGPAVALSTIVEQALQRELSLPLLLRFTNILQHRVRALQSAFARARGSEGYTGTYSVIYPIKVNQRESVLRRILDTGEGVGLEAGSKPELLAVLAMSRPGGIIICNGYKDSEYIRMALIGRRLGFRVYLVIEKLAEVPAVIRISRELGIRPWLGIRLRLASIGHGKWQNTGGENAKFGLLPGQLLEAVDRLREADMLESLRLLHFHMGSQISNIRDIHLGVSEAARYFLELAGLGVRIETVDVGGGLAVDYEGSASRGYFSMNYGLEQYAGAIVRELRQTCDQHDLPHPDIVSESGRALTAHHAVLITEVTAVESASSIDPLQWAEDSNAPPIIGGLRELLETAEARPSTEIFQEAQYLFAEGKEKFVHGLLDLKQRAEVDDLFYAICHRVRARLKAARRADRAAEDELRRVLADKYFCNFSIFRSLPDVWAIDQVFPIVPVEGLDRRPERRAVLEDLTCDSDGRIDHYVEAEGLESTLPVHRFDPGQPYRLAVFMVGAYQEILGDDHNLFGRTHSIDVTLENGDFSLGNTIHGDSAASVLAEVGYPRSMLLEMLSQRIDAADDLHNDQRDTFLQTVERSLDAYTYLTTDEVER